MTVQIEMDMPECCRKCRFCIHKTEAVGKCLALPIKDLDNEVVDFQRVDIHPETSYGNERNKHCPLRIAKRVLPTPQQLDKLVQKEVGGCMCRVAGTTCFPARGQIQDVISEWELIRGKE